MTRLTLLAFVCTIAIIFLDIAVIAKDAHEEPHSLDDENKESSERSGRAMAFASAKAGTGAIGQAGVYNGQGGYGPVPGFLECYVCTDCPKVLANTTSKICPRALDVSKQNTCVVYSEKFHHMKKRWVTRGCASERGSCADIRRSRESHNDVVSLDYCVECEGTKCNTNGASRSDFAIATLLIAITPLIKKYTL